MTTPTTTITTYQGLDIFGVEEVQCRHPRYGDDKPVKLEGASLLLLSDDSELVVCHDCEFNGITGLEPYVKPEGETKTVLQQANSVSSHRSNTHNRTVPPHPLYSDETLRQVIRVYLKWEKIYDLTRVRNWGDRAARELDEMGVKPLRAESWSSATVGNLARRNMIDAKFKNIKPAAITDEQIEELRRIAPLGVDFTRVERIGRPHRHTPVNFDQIIADKEAAAQAAPLSGPGNDDAQEEQLVANRPDPVFNYTAAGLPSTKSLPVGKVPQQQAVRVSPGVYVHTVEAPSTPGLVKVDPSEGLMAATGNHVAPWEKPAVESDFKLIVENEAGEPVFLYKGTTIMVGKKVKDYMI